MAIRNYKFVDYPEGSIKDIEELKNHKQFYLAVPHMEKIDKIFYDKQGQVLYTKDFAWYKNRESFTDANVGQRNTSNNNFLFSNYWLAVGYVLRWTKENPDSILEPGPIHITK